MKMEFEVTDESIVKVLAYAAQTINKAELMYNTNNIDSSALFDFGCINHVIEYFGGTPIKWTYNISELSEEDSE